MPALSALSPRAALTPWLQLVKAPLCLGVAVSAGFGAVLHTPLPTRTPALVAGAVFFLACGAAGLNSCQEKELDRHFCRTRNRPMVTGRIAAGTAIGLSALLACFGLTLLLTHGGLLPLLLGLAAMALYNGLYTPLKQSSIYALLPGGLAGALPPLIGWTAAGGAPTDPPALALFTLFFLWQIPHFCLILLAHQQEYRCATQPTLIRSLPEQSLKRITLAWTLALAVAALALALDRQLVPPARVTLALMAAALLLCVAPLVHHRRTPDYRRLFLLFNTSLFAALLTVAALQLASATFFSA